MKNPVLLIERKKPTRISKRQLEKRRTIRYNRKKPRNE